MATLVPCGVRLRSDFNQLAPGRDKASDGWIGDTAHQQEKSDHNPAPDGQVHAIDVDDDLRTPGLTMEAVVQFLVARARAGLERRLRYVIYNRRIWEASNGWRQRAYTGPSPHTEHAHFSFSYDPTLEASTVSWHLEEIPVALTDADKAWFREEIADRIAAAAHRIGESAAEQVWATPMQRPREEPGKMTSAGAYQAYNDVVTADNADRVVAALAPKLDQLLAGLKD